MPRPIVLVLQEFANVTPTPDVPDLNCLLVGPAYHIQDYLDDKASIQVADYGTLNANNAYVAPLAATDAITVAEPPNNATGALLDAASVKVFLDEARVLISEDVATGAAVTANSNVVTGAGGTTFITDGVTAGDTLVIQDPSNPGVADDLVRTVLAVDSETALRVTQNFEAADTCTWRVEREVDDIEVDSSFITVTSNEVVVAGGVTTTLTGESSARTVNYGKAYLQYRSLRQDLRGTIDTVVSNTQIESKIGRIDARNPLAGVAYAALQNTTTAIQFYGVSADTLAGHNECQELIEARNDIYAIVPLTTTLGVITSWKSNVEQLADATTAKTTGVPQKFRSVIGAYDLPTTKVVSGTYTAGNHESVDGAITGTPIAAADDINVFVDAAATFVTDGVRAGDTLVIANDATREGSYTVAEVYDENRLRTTTAFVGATSTSAQYYIIRGTGTPVSGTAFTGGTLTAATDLATADGTVTGVAGHAGQVLRITSASPTTNQGDWLIEALDGAGPPATWTLADTDAGVIVDSTAVVGSVFDPVMSVVTPRAVTTRRCFRVIRDNTATFSTDNVVAGDLLQVPNPVSGTDYDTNAPSAYTVAYVPLENVVVLEANSDVVATAPTTGDTDSLNFRISRTLTKDDQVDELAAVAAGIDSRRGVMVWPDSVEVTDLVDGSKTRTVSSTPEAADAQPGYYLAGVVGALTAALPSHQGFTNLGIAGVDKINNSSRYFSDSQLTELSDSGWFVFVQATEASVPYCVHQLTTDPDTLQTGEFSLVKNFDFIATFFQDILDDFLGEYNVNEETIGFLENAIDVGVDTLRLRRYPKIGAPLISAELSLIQQSSSSADKVEAYLNIQMPSPLNRIELHLVSS